MKAGILFFYSIFVFLVLTVNLASALSVNADYIKIYPGEQGSIKINVDNNNNVDIEDVSVALVLSTASQTGTVSLPFSFVGSSEKTLDDLDDGDEDSATFTLKASANTEPGDYNIPYIISYKEVGENTTLREEGTFGLRVSAKTDLDFSVETSEPAIIGQQGQITFEVINKGLGDIKSVSIQLSPNGFDLLSTNKVFIGTVDAEDSDTASFDVVYKTANPVFTAQISYKDFENNNQTQVVNLPIKAYTEEQALNLGLIQKSRTTFYLGILIVILIIWYIWRRIRKRRKQREKMAGR